MLKGSTMEKADCKHASRWKYGKDKDGAQRFKCKSCGMVWTDKRKFNGRKKQLIQLQSDLFELWLRGMSYNEIGEYKDMPPSTVNYHVLSFIRDHPSVNQMNAELNKCFSNIKIISIDGLWLPTNVGKKLYIFCCDVCSRYVIHFQQIDNEKSYEVIAKYLYQLRDTYNLKPTYILSDLLASYQNGILLAFPESTQVKCRVHMLNILRKYGTPLMMKRKYRITADVASFEDWVKQLLFQCRCEAEWIKVFRLERNFKITDLRKKVIKKIEEWQDILMANVPYNTLTNNILEGIFSIVKSRFNHCRLVGEANLPNYLDALVLRYNMKKSITYNGTVIAPIQLCTGFDCLSYTDVLRSGKLQLLNDLNLKDYLLYQHEVVKTLIFLKKKLEEIIRWRFLHGM